MSTGKKPQRHVKFQLASFLIRYGSRGSDVTGTAMKMGIGHGTVIHYCRRVTRAIRELRNQYLGWYSEDRKVEVMDRIEAKSGFPNCLGSGDGSLVRLEERPEEQGEAFIGRKSILGVCLSNA